MNGTFTKYEGKRGTTWHGRYSYVDPTTGRRVWKRVAAPTKKACQHKVTEALAKINAGEQPKDDKLTVGAFLDQWLGAHESGVRATTHRRYAGIVRTHLAPALGTIRLTRLTALDLQALYRRLLAAGSSPANVAYAHTVIRAALNQGVRWGLLDRNVATFVRPPSAPLPEFSTWTTEEVGTVLARTDATDLAAFWRVAVLCGLRRGELLGLWWEDIDLDRGTLAVRRTLQKTKAGWQLGPPKTTSSRRAIELPDSCVAALRTHRDRQAFARQRLGDLWHVGPDFVFTGQSGGPLHINTVIRRFSRLIADAGVTKIRFHDLRHTCATLMLKQGVHPKVVQEMLGHSSIAMTLDRYSHVLQGMGRSAANALDGSIQAAVESEIAKKVSKSG